MGRPKLHTTVEDRLAAARLRSQRYYEKNKAGICKTRKAKYDASKALKPTIPSSGLPGRRLSALSQTEDERKLYNKLKSQRSYQRRKSTAVRKRQSKDPRPSLTITTKAGNWEKCLGYLKRDFSKALHYQEVDQFVHGTAIAYIECGFQNVLDTAQKPFEALLIRLEEYQAELGTQAGAGAPMTRTYELTTEIRLVMKKLEDLWENCVLQGYKRFSKWYWELTERRLQKDHLEILNS